jgi:hypothetical protein
MKGGAGRGGGRDAEGGILGRWMEKKGVEERGRKKEKTERKEGRK